jgi:hypothetical protein
MEPIIINELPGSHLAPEVTVEVKPWIQIIEGTPKKTDYDLAGAATFLGVTERHLKDLCRLNRIVHDKPHYRTYHFRRSDLETFQERLRKRVKK